MDNRTGNYQLWTTRIDISRLVNVSEIQNTPYEFELEQNYPNPFNASTKIKFILSKESFVRLEIKDLLGNTIEVLIDEFLKKGNYEIIYSPKNIASGVHFYQLFDGSNKRTKKMVFLK